MAGDKLTEEIIELITETTASDADQGDVKTSFVNGVDVDSLMALEIVAALERKYKIEIKEDDLPQLGTLDGMVAMVTRLTGEKSGRQEVKKRRGVKVTKPRARSTSGRQNKGRNRQGKSMGPKRVKGALKRHRRGPK